ncbi:LysR family transcriptional regulator [Sneathiella limimaris]|uniref:LysR family transcriptional regulator n=1 Tax=Sneathiella limimaris TaxID=1964213 RepID=UPI00146C02EB|nr:LysR family transcriptional regulator [Sneathiella limimaris]
MKLEALQTLHAIVTEGSFRAAASRMNKAQSALSHAIAKLEDDVGFPLLSRETYRPELTQKGKIFYQQAQQVLQQMHLLRNVTQSLNAGQEAEVKLAVTATYPLFPMLDLVADLKSKWPATHIKLARENMGGALNQLMTGQADVIIATLDGVPLEDVEVAALETVTILPVASPKLISDTDNRVYSRLEMQRYTQVVVADSRQGEFTQSRDLLPGAERWTVSDFYAKKEIILSGHGWGGMPDHLIESEMESGLLVPLDIEDFPSRTSRIFKIRRRDSKVGLVGAELWDSLKKGGVS